MEFEHQILFYLGLSMALVLLMIVANRLRVAYPIVLVTAGLLISFVPGLPELHIDPKLIFLIFLPPLLFRAAWGMSCKELWRWRRIIISFALLVVLFTAFSVALVSDMLLPGFTLALGFLLGGIVSPPDAVSVEAVLGFVKVPKRIASMLQGESLLNDATSLIIFRFALITVTTGNFIWQDAAIEFCWMIAGGTVTGLTIGYLIILLDRALPTNADMDVLLMLITPYLLYITGEQIHSSGILAVVSGGLLLSNKRHSFLSSSSRLKGSNVWDSLIFIFNGIVFLLIGLAVPEITGALSRAGIPLSEAIWYGLLITMVLIASRFLSVCCAVVTTLIARNFIRVADRQPGWRVPVVLGWAGMRGVVSLAAALSIPVTGAGGAPVPHRDLILFITFMVILTSLLLQGLTLPVLIRKLNLPEFNDYMPEREAGRLLQEQLERRAVMYFRERESRLDPSGGQRLAEQWTRAWKSKGHGMFDIASHPESGPVLLGLLEDQRQWLIERNKTDAALDDGLVLHHLQLIDMEEEKLRMHQRTDEAGKDLS